MTYEEYFYDDASGFITFCIINDALLPQRDGARPTARNIDISDSFVCSFHFPSVMLWNQVKTTDVIRQ